MIEMIEKILSFDTVSTLISRSVRFDIIILYMFTNCIICKMITVRLAFGCKINFSKTRTRGEGRVPNGRVIYILLRIQSLNS